MALVLADRVEQVTRTTGFADLTLAETIRGRQSFASVVSNGDTVIYVLEDAEGMEWEIGVGTIVLDAETTLQRTTIRASSNAGAKISLSAGTHRVFLAADAQYLTDIISQQEVDQAIAAHVAEPDPHPQYTTTAEAAAAAPVQTVNGQTGTVSLDAAAVGATPDSHVGSGGAQHAEATISVAGFMSAADKTKLDGVESGATADQSAAEVPYDNSTSGLTATDVQAAVDEVDGNLDDHVAAGDPHTQYALKATLASNAAGQGSDRVAYTGTEETVTEALDNRTIYVGSVAELEALSLAAGTNVYLTEEGRAGEFVVKTGTAPTDTLKGVYIVIANGNYAERSEKRFLTPEMFGAVGDGIADDTLPWQEAERLSARFVFGKFGSTYLCSDTVNVTTPVQTDFNGSTVNFSLTTTIPGFYAKANNVTFANGTVNVTGLTMGGNAHSLACITSGIQLTGQGWKGLRVSGITASTNRSDAGATIAILGACTNFVVENITFPDNPDMAIGVGCEWGGADPLTGHPHNGQIYNIVAGALTAPAVFPKSNFVVWMSSCFNMDVRDVRATQCYGLVGIHAGDNGNQFAPEAYKELVGTGIKVRGIGCPKVTGEAIRVTGKGSSTPTILPMSVEIDGIRAIADGTVAATYAFYGEQFDGPTIRNFYFEGFTNGLTALAFADNLTIEHGKVTLCDNYGAQIGSVGNPAKNPVIRHVEFVKNNQSGGGTTVNSAIRYLNTRNGAIEHCVFGEDGLTETQKYSITIESVCREPEISNNYTWGHVVGGFSYIIGNSADTQINAHGINNRSAPGVANHAGAPIFQIQLDGTRHFVDDGIPTNGTFAVGDKVFFTAPAAAGWIGAVCTVAGTVGTWKRFGQIEA